MKLTVTAQIFFLASLLPSTACTAAGEAEAGTSTAVSTLSTQAFDSSELTQCKNSPLALQVLGSGGPEMTDQRASTSYLVWQNGKAIVLIDAGAGSALSFERSDARIEDLQAIAFTHLHVDHSVDFVTLVKASFFTQRDQDLPVFGPTGNNLLPSIEDFTLALFGPKGAWPYLGSFFDSESSAQFHFVPQTVTADEANWQTINENLRLGAIRTHHGPLPALAWRIETKEGSITISGDMSNRRNALQVLGKETDLLVAHNAVPEAAGGVLNLHMPPSEIGKIAAVAKPGQLLITHRMNRTLRADSEDATSEQIRKNYSGPLMFADDMECFKVSKI